MAKKAAKPKGWRAFDSLAKKLVRVPKKEVKKKRRKKRGK